MLFDQCRVDEDIPFFVLLMLCMFIDGSGSLTDLEAVGMGAEAQKVPAAAELYKKANEILG